MNHNNNILIIFIKNPIKGAVKTRLAKEIGEEPALAIYKKLIEHTIKITKPLGFDKVVCYSQFIDRMDEWSNKKYKKIKQTGDDLGDRMKNAFLDYFKQNYNKAVIIGADCYQLTTEIIESAFHKLDESDMVFGPANDGGYYLLGIKSMHYPLFYNKYWGTDTVLKESIDDANEAGLSFQLLEQLTDIDIVKDLDESPALKDSISTKI
ncbi:MAG: TIGR04282 family arsenosugar biosynthesis glycosyltransferase [Bacteroidales bacterium]